MKKYIYILALIIFTGCSSLKYGGTNLRNINIGDSQKLVNDKIIIPPIRTYTNSQGLLIEIYRLTKEITTKEKMVEIGSFGTYTLLSYLSDNPTYKEDYFLIVNYDNEGKVKELKVDLKTPQID